MTTRTERRDRLGRRIGYNWWREYIMEAYSPARQVWENDFETATNMTYAPGIIAAERRRERRGGRREATDFLYENHPPTLKAFLLAEAGRGSDPTEG
jgi:hypothetical protein